MEQLNIDFTSESHESNGFILDLGHESFVVLALGCDKLCYEVLTISFSDSFTLTVKHICKIIMIFLAGVSDFDEGNH